MRSRASVVIISLLLCLTLSLASPGIASTSDTQSSTPLPKDTTSLPFSLVYSGAGRAIVSDASILIQIDTDDLDMLVSACPDSRRILASSSTRTILAWSVQADCPAPLVTYRGTTYIIPTPDRIIPTSTLSDLSTQTLERTRAVSMTLATDIRLANIKTRKTLLNIQAVLNARGQKFQPPIADAQLPTKSSYLPNSSRPFRADATDGVHHGWDFYTEKGTQVLAVEDGTIVHVKRDFDWSEMDHLADPTDELARQENLDVYRGNTVYLKTVSGHIAIYAHLEHIPDTLAVGQYVRSGTVLGEVGGSAVPDKKYLYHLHFELAMNPFFDAAAGTYGMSDYLVWPWWGKGKGSDWVRENDETLFQ